MSDVSLLLLLFFFFFFSSLLEKKNPRFVCMGKFNGLGV